MATLRQYLLHNSLPTAPENHLFYAVSPSAKSDKFTVRFLTQHRKNVERILARLVTHLPGIQGGSMSQQNMAKTTPSHPVATMPQTIQHNKQKTNLATPVERAYEALETIFARKFTRAFEPNPPANSKLSFVHSDPITSRTIIPTSNHKLYHWLKALLTLFQNTAWDRWRYQLGILAEPRDPSTMAPCRENQLTISFSFSFQAYYLASRSAAWCKPGQARRRHFSGSGMSTIYPIMRNPKQTREATQATIQL